MSKKTLSISRRKVLGGMGAAALAAGGVTALSGGAAAQSSASGITSNGVTVSDDRGQVGKVTIDPSFDLNWSGFDDAVAKIMVVIEAAVKPNGGSWSNYTPIFRMTPWLDPGGHSGSGLNSTGPGTTGHFHVNEKLSALIASDSRYAHYHQTDWNAKPPRPVPRPLEVTNRKGRPGYEGANYNYYGGSASSYLGGGSLGHAYNAETNLVENQGLPLVNNLPTVDAGYYGATANSSVFENTTDGSNQTGQVALRYTFAFLRANMSYMKYKYNNGTAFSDPQAAAAASNGTFEASDIDTGNSAVCMSNGQTSKNYASLQSQTALASILSTVIKFDVSVTNQAASATSSGTSNTGATGYGQ